MTRRTILVVDDEPHIRALVKAVLGRERYEMLEAEDGEQGLDVCRERSADIDLLLTDIVMPRLDGIGLAARVSSAYPGIRVLYMSGKCEMDVVRRDIQEKGFGFIRKPFAITELVRKVDEILSGVPQRMEPKREGPPASRSSTRAHSG